MIIRVVDLETTGFPPDAEVVELATIDVCSSFRALVGDVRSRLVKPGRPIPPTASAVHHIVDADVRYAEPWPVLWRAHACGVMPDVWAAHSAKFERAFITDEMADGRPWICTWKCALRLWPDAPSHSNQVLRYVLNPPGLERHRAEPAHRAGPDAYVTAHLLATMLERSSVEQLIAWTAEPAQLARVPFGRSKGLPWYEVDTGFLYWVLERDFDEDVLFTAQSELQRREAAATANEDVS